MITTTALKLNRQRSVPPSPSSTTTRTRLRYVAAWNAAFLPSRDFKEGIAAMFEKRAPNVSGD